MAVPLLILDRGSPGALLLSSSSLPISSPEEFTCLCSWSKCSLLAYSSCLIFSLIYSPPETRCFFLQPFSAPIQVGFHLHERSWPKLCRVLLYLCLYIGSWWLRLGNINLTSSITFIQTIYSSHIYFLLLLSSENAQFQIWLWCIYCRRNK